MATSKEAIDRFLFIVDTLGRSPQIDLKDITEEGDEAIFIDEEGIVIILNKDYLLYARKNLIDIDNNKYFIVDVIGRTSKKLKLLESTVVKLKKAFKVNSIIVDEVEIKVSFYYDLFNEMGAKLKRVIYPDLIRLYDTNNNLIHIAQLKYENYKNTKYYTQFSYYVDADYIQEYYDSWKERDYNIFDDTYFLFDNIHADPPCSSVILTKDNIIINELSEILEKLEISDEEAEQLIITPSFMKVIIDDNEHIITSDAIEENYQALRKNILGAIKVPIVFRKR
ncbi:MAG: hypothetical protein QXI58_01085 [Candidatus Micrarchaeia archaeon]